MPDLEQTETDTENVIAQYVEEHWSKTQTVCYLSSIGSHLKQKLPQSKTVLAKGLGEFLRRSPIVRIVQYPGVEQKIGAVPLSVTLPEDVIQLFATDKHTTNPKNQRTYIQEFWNAFSHPLNETSRYILIDEDNRISVHDGSIEGDVGKRYEVQPTDLPTAPHNGTMPQASTIHSAIEAWLEKFSLDSEIFLRHKFRNQKNTISPRLAKFLSAFNDLSLDDLERIEIPLDILFKLNSKK